MRKLKNFLAKLLIILIVFGIIFLCFKFDYMAWRVQHPNAPGWSYIWLKRK